LVIATADLKLDRSRPRRGAPKPGQKYLVLPIAVQAAVENRDEKADAAVHNQSCFETRWKWCKMPGSGNDLT
jgi:hypothetical protein